MKCLMLLVFAMLLLSNVSAYTFITIYIEEDGSTTFVGETDQNITLPEGIKLQDGKISGKTDALTNKQGSTWSFAYNLLGSELTVILPKGAVIKSITAGEVSIRRGQIAIDSTSGVELSYIVEPQPLNGLRASIAIPLIVGIAAIVVIIVFAFNYHKREKPKKPFVHPSHKSKMQKEKLMHQLLSERQNQILTTLRQTGKIKISHLRKLTQIPKASLSRHIQELEKKRLVIRSGEGKNKFIELVR